MLMVRLDECELLKIDTAQTEDIQTKCKRRKTNIKLYRQHDNTMATQSPCYQLW